MKLVNNVGMLDISRYTKLKNEVSFCDLKGDKHRLKFEWLVSPDFEYLKKYFTTYKKTKRHEKIYKCQDDIETFKSLIAEREEELKQLENEED